MLPFPRNGLLWRWHLRAMFTEFGISDLDRDDQTLRVEFDATRLNAAAVTKLVRETGLQRLPRIADSAAT